MPGSIASLSDSTGNHRIAAAPYDSFGNLTSSTGTVTNPFRYTAREFDTETGIYYYRARYYFQGVGRFASEDSARFAGGGSNFYRYVENSPSNYSDPTGHLTLDPNRTVCGCDTKAILKGISQLGSILDNAQIKGGKAYQKYRNCLKNNAFPNERVKCTSSPGECGHFYALDMGSVTITPAGSQGRRGGCPGVANTLIHELTHACYYLDLQNPEGLNETQLERDAYKVECEIFGTGCYCARHPERCLGR